jgi:hypothetical protein
MIRNAVVHMQGDQPFMADLEALPTPADAALVCTNVRLAGGKKPTFIDHSESTFLIPLIHVRFVEIPPTAEAIADAAQLTAGDVSPPTGDEELELDEDFLRRVREA